MRTYVRTCGRMDEGRTGRRRDRRSPGGVARVEMLLFHQLNLIGLIPFYLTTRTVAERDSAARGTNY